MFGLAVPKAIVAHVAKALAQHVLKDAPEEVDQRQGAERAGIGLCVVVAEGDAALDVIVGEILDTQLIRTAVNVGGDPSRRAGIAIHRRRRFALQFKCPKMLGIQLIEPGLFGCVDRRSPSASTRKWV